MAANQRLEWLDAAKGYGMFLVFYGHLAERFADIAAPGALAQFKFVYAFHMPLFFVLAGLVAIETPTFLGQLWRGLVSRLVPALVFNLLLVLAWLPPSPLADPKLYSNILPTLLLLATGRPVFNILTWFLICLFVVELMHVGLRRIARSNLSIIVSILGLFALGQWVAFHLGDFKRLTGLPVHIWYIDVAIVAAGFFQIGFLARRNRAVLARVLWPGPTALRILFCVAAWLMLWLTYDLNQGPFRWAKPVVGMVASSHGDPFLFPLTAIIGTAAVVALAMLTSFNRIAVWIGRRSLIFLGLNAFCLLFNGPIARALAPRLPDGAFVLGAVLVGLTMLQLAVTAPIAEGLGRLLPQLFGQPRVSGPLLPALMRSARTSRG